DVACVEDIARPIVDGNADMVIGSRFVEGAAPGFRSSFLRRIGIKIISLVLKIRTGKRISDATSGFRAVGRSLISEFSRAYPTEYPEPISSVSALLSGYRITEIPTRMREREGGVSSIRTWKTMYYMINVVLSILLAGRALHERTGIE
ncbi:MAG: glycosyltransferase family 2 protein, partial [Treponema sp.]|nr:glycosyltransferase family 2 protein [Treponema sp.]